MKSDKVAQLTQENRGLRGKLNSLFGKMIVNFIT